MTVQEPAAQAIGEDETPDPSYAFKPSLVGSWCEFKLKPDGLHWQIGLRKGASATSASARCGCRTGR